ncbi:MAG: energy-coupling factor transporter ATPase [Clostridiales bacterium]|jgi:energy-coupling factor transport system ATP-binding protein|nr:energy-coupling factor transporter ATPase [Clostridiales bacterium]
MIEIKDLTFAYEEKQVLKNISLDIPQGQFIAILGHNGSGKSTLARMMNALLVPDSGELLVNGVNTKDEARMMEIRRSVGMVFQNPDNQIVAAIVEEDVAFALENLGVESSEIRRRVDLALEEVGLSDYATHAPHYLSGGQKQRVAIAGVIAMQPNIIVLDEATAMLDPKGRRDILALVEDMHKKGKTIVYITHNMSEAIKADRVIVLDEGELVLDGTPREVYANTSAIVDAGLELPRPCQVTTALGLGVALDIDESVELINASK